MSACALPSELWPAARLVLPKAGGSGGWAALCYVCRIGVLGCHPLPCTRLCKKTGLFLLKLSVSVKKTAVIAARGNALASSYLVDPA